MMLFVLGILLFSLFYIFQISIWYGLLMSCAIIFYLYIMFMFDGMKMSQILLVATSVFLIFPIVLAFQYNLAFGLVINILILLSSFAVYWFDKTDFVNLDFIFAILGIIFNIYLLMQVDFPALSVGLGIISIIAAIYFYYEGKRTEFVEYYAIGDILCSIFTIVAYNTYIIYLF